RWPDGGGERDERGADQGLVDKTIRMIGEQEQVDVVTRRKIGAHLFIAYFGADAKRVKSKLPTKSQSYGLLCDRVGEETTWNEDTLRRAVVAEVVARTLDPKVASRLAVTYLFL